jgi:hypothetical protein
MWQGCPRKNTSEPFGIRPLKCAPFLDTCFSMKISELSIFFTSKLGKTQNNIASRKIHFPALGVSS